MDAPQCSHLCAASTDVPDPRKRRGRRYPWPVLLTPIAAALVSGQQGVRGVGRWADEHAEEFIRQLALPERMPSTATLRRALRAVDVTALEDRLARFAADLPTPAVSPAAPPAWDGLAVDGKAVRGANRHGARVHLISLVRHADGWVLGQIKVAAKTNEIGAAPGLLAGHSLAGAVVTLDAWQVRTGAAPQALAALRSGLLNLLRALGWTNIADAVRHYGAHTHRALALLATPRLPQ